jgi:Holliday junction resolvasome RuvABC endonuclease subunit
MDEPQLRVMGLDLSVNGSGVCLPDGSTLRIGGKTKEGDWRLIKIRDHIRMAVRTSYTRVVVMEGIRGHFPGNTQARLGEVHGVVKAELMDLGVPYSVVNQATLKLFATGKGSADKLAMAAAARLSGHPGFSSDDECDAWWLWRAGLAHYGGDPYPLLPVPQRAALEAVPWAPAPAPRTTAAGPEKAAEGM